MSHPVPAIVVTLPARTCAEARRQMEEAKTGGADLVEVRLDRFSSDQLASIGTLFPAPLPTIATLRSRAEGGEGPDDRETRARVLRELARHPFRWIDVESARDFPLAEGLTRPGVLDLVVSTHLRETVRGSEWVRQLRESIPNGAVRKLVGPASVGQALRELMPGIPPPGEIPLAAMTTGPSGPLFRVWSRKLGFSFVYASLPRRKDSGPVAPVEPSQIPVDRLRRFLDADGTPPLFGVVGHPVAHSRSPDLHARWMRDEDRLGLYVALDVESDQEFAEVLPSLIEGGFRGLNITHPLKEVALGLADRVGPGAAACGVANTLTVGPEEVEAENTDLVAILRRLGELRSSGRWEGSSVGVLGAGGAARATLAAARSTGTSSLVWARRGDASERLAREFEARAVHESDPGRPSLVVHATTVGRSAGDLPEAVCASWFRPGVHVVDWVYLPENPVLRLTAERAGSTYEDGLRLLVYQAGASYALWWGSEPTPEQATAALEEIA